MKRKELTPAQTYLLNAFRMLANEEASTELLTALLERPKTLKSAISAAFYKSVGYGIDRYL